MIFPDLSVRDRQPELMDEPTIGDAEHQWALRGLARLNRASAIASTVWRVLKPVARDAHAPLRVLDIACGSGDLIVEIGQKAARAGVPLSLSACDISETALHVVHERGVAAGIDITTLQADVTQQTPEGEYDVVMSHLFFHHLDETAIVDLLRQMDTLAKRLVLVTDLIRDRRGYALAWLASRVLTRSPVVHVDALLSVAGALRPDELAHFAKEAEVSELHIDEVWPRRMVLTIRKGGA